MMKFKDLYLTFLAIGLAGLAYAGLFNLSLRPVLPVFPLQTESGLWLVYADSSGSSTGALIQYVEKQAVRHLYELTDIIDEKRIGETVLLLTAKNRELRLTLLPRYENWQMILKGILGFIFFTLAVITWILRKNNERYFAIATFLFGISILVDWPGVQLHPALSIPIIISYFAAFPQAIFSFLFFSYSFPNDILPRKKLQSRKILLRFMGITASIALATFYLVNFFSPSPKSRFAYHTAVLSFEALFIGLLILALVNMYMNEKKNSHPVTERKFQWVVLGTFWGLTPILLLWYLPLRLNLPPLLPSWSFDLFFLFIPAGITVALLRYRLFNIEHILAHSLVYGALTLMLAAVFLTSFEVFQAILSTKFAFHPLYISIICTLLTAFLANPLRKTLRHLVDAVFFRLRTARRKRLHLLKIDLNKCTNRHQLLERVSEYFQESVPLKSQLFLIRENGHWMPQNNAGGLDTELSDWIATVCRLPLRRLLFNEYRLMWLEKPLSGKVLYIPSPWLVILPVGDNIVWLLGPKESRTPFWQEDIRHAREMAALAAEYLEKLVQLQQAVRESLIQEEAEYTRLKRQRA